MNEPNETGPDEIIFRNVVSILKEGGYPFVLLMGTDTRIERMQSFRAANGGDGATRLSMIQQASDGNQNQPIVVKALQLARQTEAWGAGRNQAGLARWISKAPEPPREKEVLPDAPVVQAAVYDPPAVFESSEFETEQYEQEQETFAGVEGDYDLSEYEETYDDYDDY